jgi:pentose-5-phosphate-3-epimerase
MILPSLLEYSQNDLKNRIQSLKKLDLDDSLFDLIKVHEKSKSKRLNLHLDFVLKQFAKDRVPILSSLSLVTVFEILDQEFSDQKLNLSVHLMGAIEDLTFAWEFFKKYKKPKDWKITLFLPQNHALRWKSEFKKYKIGVWLDLHDWLDIKELKSKSVDLGGITNVLIMTVVAGKSGQSLTEEVQKNLKDLIDNLCEQNLEQKKYIIVDGGWNQEKAKIALKSFNKSAKVDFVAYGGFWGKVNIS